MKCPHPNTYTQDKQEQQDGRTITAVYTICSTCNKIIAISSS